MDLTIDQTLKKACKQLELSRKSIHIYYELMNSLNSTAQEGKCSPESKELWKNIFNKYHEHQRKLQNDMLNELINETQQCYERGEINEQHKNNIIAQFTNDVQILQSLDNWCSDSNEN